MAGGRPLCIAWRDEATVAAVARAYRTAPDRHVARRLQGLWCRRQGHGSRTAAPTLGLSERSLPLWVAWYRAGGLAAVCAHRLRGPGGTPTLSVAQQTALCAQLATGAVPTAADAVAWVQEQYGVAYRRQGQYSLRARLPCRPNVPRPSNPKSSVALQEAWKKGARRRPDGRRSTGRPGDRLRG